MILWSLLAPLGAVAFGRPERAWPWFGAFVATIALALVLSEVVRPDGADLPNAFVRTFDVLNIVAVSFVAMLLLVTFARGRDAAQERVEALLLNILPDEVARATPAGSEHDRRSLRRGEHPLRRRRRLHADVEPARRPRGRRPPRPPLHELRRARRPLRGREDQDDRRLLHGRRRRADAPSGPRAGARGPRARDARVRARRASRSRARSTSGFASGSAPARSSPA